MSFCNDHYVIDAKNDVLSVTSILRRIQALIAAVFNTIVPDYGDGPSLVLVPTNKAAQQFKASSLLIPQHICLDECSVLEGRYSLLSGENIIIGTPDSVSKILPKDFLIPDCIKEITLYKTDELFARGFKEEVFFSFIYRFLCCALEELPLFVTSNHSFLILGRFITFSSCFPRMFEWL